MLRKNLAMIITKKALSTEIAVVIEMANFCLVRQKINVVEFCIAEEAEICPDSQI